jgi:hypothetical protein
MTQENRTAFLTTLGSLLLLGAFLYFFYFQPEDIGPEQPIPFSHNVHSGIKQIQCQYCHPYVAYSNFPGMPPVEKCLHCHNYIIVNHPWIQKEHQYFDRRIPTPWIKVNAVPEHVFFNHQRHINSNLACEECHGEVKNLQRLPQKIWRMGQCLECHHQKKASVDCWLTCHN